jgi:MFS-type transporter involved in bile tolerance (Atg22 family)
MAVKLVPAARMGEVFGLFDLVGKLSAVVGPIFFGLIRFILSPFGEWSYRIALLSLSLFLAISIYYFRRVEFGSLS